MDKIALVTGGTRGIGGAISRTLTQAGYKVCANYAGNDKAAEEFAKETGIKTAKWDVSDFDACQAGVAEIERTLGKVNVLVNNAGITRDTMFHRMSREQWDQVIRTDLYSVFNLTRAVIDGMREQGFGRIINISSINGQKGQAGQVNYSAAKAGMIGFAKALALETAAKGITVNTIAPGYTETDMVAAVPEEVMEKIVSQIPARRLGQVNEIAKCVEFLASQDAGFITGATLSANGGQYMA